MGRRIHTRREKQDADVRVGWRMAGLASETVSYVLAGGLVGWLLQEGLGGEYWVPLGFGIGILSGIGVLLRGALKLNRTMDRQRAQNRSQRSDKGDLTRRSDDI